MRKYTFIASDVTGETKEHTTYADTKREAIERAKANSWLVSIKLSSFKWVD